MKKLLSMVLALTTVFSSFAAIVKAELDPEVWNNPTATVKVTVTPTKLTDGDYDDAVELFLDEAMIDSESDLEGYAIYQIDAYVEGLELDRENTSAIAGTMLSGFEFAVNGDMSKFKDYYIDSNPYPYMGLAKGPTGFSLSWDAGKFKGTKTFPKKGVTVDPEEPTLFYTALVIVVDNTRFVVNTSSFATSEYEAGNPGAQTSYSTICYQKNLDFGTISSGGSGGGETLPGEAADDEGKIVAKEAGAVSGLSDIAGNPVTSLSENYGIAKFTQTINTVAKDYYVFAKDTEGKTNINLTAGGEFATPEDKAFADSKFKINFAIEGIDTNGTVSFYALVHSATHVIDTIRLIAVDK